MDEPGYRIFRTALRKKLCPSTYQVQEAWDQLPVAEKTKYAIRDAAKREKERKPNLKQLLWLYDHRIITQEEFKRRIIINDAMSAIRLSKKK
tara:strand:+ start:1939 stop:2214 length:276 start_codon:yes stop_codon:yes gene_type:complete